MEVFKHVAKQLRSLTPDQHEAFGVHLFAGCLLCRDFGYGVYDDVRDKLADHGFAT